MTYRGSHFITTMCICRQRYVLSQFFHCSQRKGEPPGHCEMQCRQRRPFGRAPATGHPSGSLPPGLLPPLHMPPQSPPRAGLCGGPASYYSPPGLRPSLADVLVATSRPQFCPITEAGAWEWGREFPSGAKTLGNRCPALLERQGGNLVWQGEARHAWQR